MLVYVCVCIFASVWAYETYQGPVNSAKSHESSKVWRGFTSQPFFFFLLKRQQPPRWRTGMEININKNNNNKNNNNMPVGTGSTASSKQDVEGSISSILIFKSFFFVFWSIRWASLSSVLTVRGKQGKMPPGPFRELCGKVGAEIGAWREGR